jgi:peptide methionine sulfoxide reductase msrA/msrB
MQENKMKNKKWYLLFIILFNLMSCVQNKQKNDILENAKKTNMKLSEAEWKAKLSPNQYYVLREKGTEKPFTGEFYLNKKRGTYHCAGCGEALFTDDMKFDSHCGWPSFDKEIVGGKIIQTEDTTLGMKRTEISCARCGGHLGHIFDDGPTETGKRYCVNSLSLSFEPKEKIAQNETTEVLTLGGGCFWCIEAIFEDLKGVKSVESGYSGGKTENPTYEQICAGNTGHAEVVQITFDTKMISYEELLEIFFTLHDPTTLNRQGADVGTQYRSVLFYRNQKQKEIAQNIITTLNKNKVFDHPIVTEIVQFSKFYKAENYHQEYYNLNKEQPYCKVVIKPKMDKLHKIFADKLNKKLRVE